MTNHQLSFRSYQGALARGAFLKRMLVVTLICIGPALLYVAILTLLNLGPSESTPDTSPGSGLGTMLAIVFLLASVASGLVTLLYLPSLVIRRTRHIGITPWLNLFLVVPYVNGLYLLFLAVYPGKELAIDGGTALKASADAPPPDVASTDAPENKATKQGLAWGSTLIIALVVVLVPSIYSFLARSGNGSASERIQTLVSNKDPKEYVSTEQGFRAVFPGFPTVERDKIDLEGFEVPYAAFTASLDPDTDARVVYIWDYSSIPNAEGNLDPEGGLNAMVQGIDGAHLVSTRPAMLGGASALEGYFTAPLEGKNSDCYARIAIQGTKAYGTMSLGLAKSDFDVFSSSFQFTQ